MWKSIRLQQRLRRGEPLGVLRLAQGLEHPERRPPQGARLGQVRRELVERLHRARHVVDARRPRAQPREHAALEERAARLHGRHEAFLRHGAGRRLRRRGDADVGIEEILLAAGILAVQRRELLVDRVEHERLVGLAALQSFDELLERQDRAVEHRDRGAVGKRAAKTAEPRFDRLAESRRAGEAHHAQRPAHLVHVARGRAAAGRRSAARRRTSPSARAPPSGPG